MKSNLTLIQPIEYNNLFSSYHNDAKTTKNKNYNLPKITKLFSNTNSKPDKPFNNFKLRLKPNKLSNIINENKNYAYPLLNISINNRSMTKTTTNLESISYNIDKLYNTNNNCSLNKKLNNERSDNIHKLKMVYFNLFNIKTGKNNNPIINLDSFFNSIDNFELENNEEDKILTKKLNQINNKSIIKIKSIFNETKFDKLNNDLESMNHIQQSKLYKFSEKLLNKYKDSNNIRKDGNSIKKKANLISNNVFFDWILDNVRHKIELKNEYNQHLTTVWIQNLINDEIKELKNRFVDFRKSLNLSNYLEKEKKNYYSTNSKIISKKDDSYFTESTYRTNLNQSQRKSSMNNNSNIISNYNSSYDHDDIQKLNFIKNYTITEMNAGFDFFTSKANKIKTIKVNNTKNMIDFILKKNIKFNEINRKSNKNLNKINIKNTLIKSKNKTELNNEYKSENSSVIKNLYINNPRKNKIKNFKLNIPDDINSKIPIINHELNSNRISPVKKNVDIIEKINLNKKSNNDFVNNENVSDSEDSFSSIKKTKSKYKERHSINYLPNHFTTFQELNDRNSINKNNTRRILSPKKPYFDKRGSDTGKIPKFNEIVYKNIVKSLFKNGVYKSKNEESSDDNSVSEEDSCSSSETYESDDDDTKDNNLNRKAKKRNKTKIKLKKSKKKKKKKKTKNETNVNSVKDKKKKKSNKSKKKKKTSKEKASKKSKKEKNEQEIMNKIEKNDLIKELNQKFYHKKGKRSRFSPEDINELKKLFTKKKNRKSELKIYIPRKSIVVEEGKENVQIEEEDEPTIYSISSISNEDEDINENLQIKNEVDIMNILLSNNESKNLFNMIFEVKKQLRKKDKVEEDKKMIKENKNQIKVTVNKYFETLISKLPINNIKYEGMHLNILNELELLQRYGLYTRKDLNKLVKRALEERYDEEDRKPKRYSKFYYYDDYNDYFGDKSEKKQRIMKKSASTEVLSKKNKYNKFRNLKFDNLKNKFKQNKKELIYNNSYLFKDNHSDYDEQNKFIIKKEIQEILDKEYNEMVKSKKEEIMKEKKKKNREFYLTKKVPFKKRTIKRNNIVRLTDELINEDLLNKKNIDKEALKRELEKEKERDKKIYEFFGKIQRLKKYKRNSLDEDKLNQFLDQQIEEKLKNKTHQRLYNFLEEFNLNRLRAKNINYYLNKRIGYVSPIIFTSPNENNSLANYKNYNFID